MKRINLSLISKMFWGLFGQLEGSGAKEQANSKKCWGILNGFLNTTFISDFIFVLYSLVLWFVQ